MIKNYLRIAYRRLKNDKYFLLINTLGLSLGLATCMLILSFVKDELTYDKWHTNSDRIVKISRSVNDGAFYIGTPSALGPSMIEELPGIENVMRTSFGGSEVVISVHDEIYGEDEFHYMDPSVFTMLNFDLKIGNEKTAISNKRTVVISQEVADKYYPGNTAMGKTLLVNGDEYEITGILADFPSNSSFKMRFIAAYDNLERDGTVDSWEVGSGYTYALLQQDYTMEQMLEDVSAMVEKNKASNDGIEYHAEHFEDLYLYGRIRGRGSELSGSITYVYIFSVIAFVILLLAFANYINLSTAKATEIAKEVGVRKAVGASKRQVIFQFLGESLVITTISFLAALGLLELLLPMLNDITGKSIDLDYFGDPLVLPVFVLFIPITSLLAALYPAWVISRFNASQTLKSKVYAGGGNFGLRRVLVVFQFTISLALIASTLIIKGQLIFFQNYDLGFSKEQILRVDLGRSYDIPYNQIKDEFSKVVGEVNITGSPLPSVDGLASMDLDSVSKKTSLVFYMNVDYNFFDYFDVELEQGKAFDVNNPGKLEKTVIVNQEYMDVFGLESMGDKEVPIWLNGETIKSEIIGVVGDFHYSSLKSINYPLVIAYRENRIQAIDLRINTENTAETLAGLQSAWKDMNLDKPFEYAFLDDVYNDFYSRESKLNQLASYFTGLAIVIACLGLIGLSMFTIRKKSKEIGVRKVLGAGFGSLMLLLSKELLIFFGIAILFGSTISFFLMREWLEGFSYRINLEPVYFISGAAIFFAVAFLSFWVEMRKAAKLDPVSLLKDE